MTTKFKLPVMVTAADWSVDAENRRMAVARLSSNGSYCIDTLPASVSSASTLIRDLQARVEGTGSVLLGLDLPLGLPRAYARAAGLKSFREALELFDSSTSWKQFLIPTDEPTLHQPFAPASSKVGFGRSDLARAIGLQSEAELFRRCERKTSLRNHAESVFFLRFAKQVGRSAIHGWREVIGPSRKIVRIWPFDGTLESLLSQPGVTVVEIYPAESVAQLSLPLGPGTARSKRRRTDRAAACSLLIKACDLDAIMIGTPVRESIANGCDSEHDFDALVALVGMIRVLRGMIPSAPPDDPMVHSTEGWILGREQADYSPPQAPRAHIISQRSIGTGHPYFIKRITFTGSSERAVMDLAYPSTPGSGALNVICGLNNSGKSMLLDQIYRVVKGKKSRGALQLEPKPLGEPRVLFLGKTWTDKDRIGIVNLDQREAALTVGGEHGDYLRCGLSFMLAQMAPYLSGIQSEELPKRVLDPSVRNQIDEVFQLHKQVYRCCDDDQLVQRLERLLEGRLYIHCFRRNAAARAWEFEFVLAYEDGTTIPYPKWSDGQRACFYVLVCLSYFKPDIVLFDELENHLHPAFISDVLEMLRSFPAQSLVATHHPHLIFSRAADRVFYIETRRPKPHAYPPRELPFSATHANFERNVQELRDDFTRITATYRLFKDQDDQLLRQASFVQARATLILVQALSGLFKYPPVSESPGGYPDTQTQQLADRIGAFISPDREGCIEILDLGAGVGRQIAELRKLSKWQLGAEVRWTCYEPVEPNREKLQKRFGHDPRIAIVGDISALRNRRFDLCVIANVLHELTPPEFAGYLSLAEACCYDEKGGIVVLELFPLLHPEGFAVPYDGTTLQRMLDRIGLSVDLTQISLRQSGVTANCLLARRRTPIQPTEIQRAVEQAWEEVLAASLSAYSLRQTPRDLSGYQSLLSHLATIASISSWKAKRWLPNWPPEQNPDLGASG